MTVDNEVFYTPSYCVHRLLESLHLPGGYWLEPAAGNGDIIRAVNRDDVKWTAVDIREECRTPLVELGATTYVMDFLKTDWNGGDDPFAPPFEVGITNPPFSLAVEFLERLLPECKTVVMLQRLNWLGSIKRASLFHENMPDVYVLPNRPSFDARGTDRTEYAWFVWHKVPREDADFYNKARRVGMIQVLDLTPSLRKKNA